MQPERLPELRGSVSLAPTPAKGLAFTRYATALALGRGSLHRSVAIAESRWPRSPQIVEALHKAAVDVGTTSDADWAAPLAAYSTMASEFIDALRPASILGRIQGMVAAPILTTIPRVVSGSSGAWVGEGAPIPVSSLSLDTTSMGPTKIGEILVLSVELLQDSRPSAEALIRRDMVAEVARFSNAQFIDPTVTASASNPASITNGVTPIASTGSSVAQINTDVQAMFAAGITAGHDYAAGVWVMHPRTALYLSSALTAGNQRMWPEISVVGGTWYGLPVVTSSSVPVDTGSDSYIVLLDASDLLLADGTLTVDVASQASLQMSTTPVNAAAQMTSLWQNNLVALKVVRHINYQRRRDTAVAVLSGVSY